MGNLFLFTFSAFSTFCICSVSCKAAQASIEYVLTAGCIAEDKRGLQAAVELYQEGLPEYGPSMKSLRLHVRWEALRRLHVHIAPRTGRHWEVPRSLLPRPGFGGSMCEMQPAEALDLSKLDNSTELAFSYTKQPFGFAVQRRSTGEVLFNSTPPADGPSFSPLVFKPQYLEMSTALPHSTSLYGLGESTRPSGLKLAPNQTYTLWASDISASSRNIPLYGVHPFYMDVRESGESHGVLFLNSNGMDVSVEQEALTFRAIGGVFDWYFFPGPHPLDVMQQYTALVGRPAPVPYWALGFHQCRWGYKNVAELRQVAASYRSANIPLDALWSDIDYMDHYKDFTTDPAKFPVNELRTFVAELHEAEQHYVVIVDPGIKVEAGYPAYEAGLHSDVFVKYADGMPVLGQVWPGPVHYPDFVMHPHVVDYWQQQLARFHEMVPFDGLWIDMNEASNFCSAVHCSLPDKPHPGSLTDCFLHCSDDNATTWDRPPYRLNILGDHHSLGTKTIPMSALHHSDVRAYDAHNLYGHAEGRATHLALRNMLRKRPFVLSRSTFAGAGAWAAHWSGDNTATWDDLRYSLVSILNMGLFGVPHVGADICGFVGDTTEELCARWIQAGAMYPFSRDHSNIEAAPQELYRWPSVATAARASLGLRYRLLPYLYTLTFLSHRNGAPLAHALFMDFPADPEARAIDQQFLLGPALLVSPVLSPGAHSVEAYFPKGTWYSLVGFSRVESLKGEKRTLHAPLDSPPPVHIRGGQIVPMQGGGLTSTAARRTPFSIVVALPSAFEAEDAANCLAEEESLLASSTAVEEDQMDENVEKRQWVCASGRLFLDSGDDLVTRVAARTSTLVAFQAAATRDSSHGRVFSRVQRGQFAEKEGYVVAEIVVFGVNRRPGSISVNGQPSEGSVCYDAEGKKLVVSDLNLPLFRNFHLRWAATAAEFGEESAVESM